MIVVGKDGAKQCCNARAQRDQRNAGEHKNDIERNETPQGVKEAKNRAIRVEMHIAIVQRPAACELREQ